MIKLDQTTAVWRKEVISAFDQKTGCYSHEFPRTFSNFIDGMAWVSLMLAYALQVGDDELVEVCRRFIVCLITVGKDARNYAPFQLDGWVKSPNIPGYYYKEKPQSFAGPAALWYANQQGAGIMPRWVPDPTGRAKLYVSVGWLFGHIVRGLRIPFTQIRVPVPWLSKGLRQHVNSVMFAYMLLGKKPASSLEFALYDNPFYSAIAKKSCTTVYDTPLRKYSEGETVESKDLIPMFYRKPSSWMFRGWPYSHYHKNGEPATTSYTPIAQLVGAYAQAVLNGAESA